MLEYIPCTKRIAFWTSRNMSINATPGVLNGQNTARYITRKCVTLANGITYSNNPNMHLQVHDINLEDGGVGVKMVNRLVRAVRQSVFDRMWAKSSRVDKTHFNRLAETVRTINMHTVYEVYVYFIEPSV